jgi:hypothetical protein
MRYGLLAIGYNGCHAGKSSKLFSLRKQPSFGQEMIGQPPINRTLHVRMVLTFGLQIFQTADWAVNSVIKFTFFGNAISGGRARTSRLAFYESRHE